MRGSYRGYDIVSMPPSSSGGVILIEMLNILEGYRTSRDDRRRRRLHLMIEAMKLAYADRADFLGDPAMRRRAGRAADLEGLRRRAARRHRPRAGAAGGRDPRRRPAPREGDNTTHFSVVDRFGNAVANTYTLNFSYGVGLVAEGTGILLNNELDDFAAKPGAPNAFGLVGGEANAPGPGKRPLSSMTPTIVLKDGKPFLVTGSPGGSRIITTVLQVIVNVIDRGMPIAARGRGAAHPSPVAARRGRGRARILAATLMRALEARGHSVVERPPRHSANSILVTPDGLVGAADNAHARRAGGGVLGLTYFSDALFATSAHFAMPLARNAASCSGEPPMNR